MSSVKRTMRQFTPYPKKSLTKPLQREPSIVKEIPNDKISIMNSLNNLIDDLEQNNNEHLDDYILLSFRYLQTIHPPKNDVLRNRIITVNEKIKNQIKNNEIDFTMKSDKINNKWNAMNRALHNNTFGGKTSKKSKKIKKSKKSKTRKQK